jgi:hypothetical protein
MATNETTTSYIELTNQVYKLVVDATAATTGVVLDHHQRRTDLLLRPLNPAAGVDGNARELIERAKQITSITALEHQAISQKNAELSEKLLAHAAKVQDSLFHSWRGIWDTSLSNLNYVKETTNAHIDTFAKRVEEIQEIQKRTATAAGNASKN